MFEQVLNLSEHLGNSMVRNRPINEPLPLKGKWIHEHWRGNILLGVYETPNDITTIAKNSLFNTFFNEAAQIVTANWCAGLINNAGWTAYNVADTMGSHVGWVEFTSYSQANRVPWTQGTAASATITNASPMVFDITATGVLKGFFLTTQNTKGGTTGLLWSAASYATTVDVVSGDQIRSTYSLSC